MSESADTAEQPNPHAESVLKLAAAMQKATLQFGGVVALVAAITFTVLYGTSGLLGSVVGSAVAIVSALGTTAMMRKTANLPVSFMMVVALGGYAVKIMIVFGVMFALRGVDALHTESLAFTMLAVILVAAFAEFRAFKNTKIPTLIIESK
ncbi:hypothetical protein AB5J62_34610 [Amycolatopsis sp. cg5]|uniref:hypothetical protein n=1 Tax=Amycolatopsis sp. cg5 TaxID=3238802 RepID=UPI003526055A